MIRSQVSTEHGCVPMDYHRVRTGDVKRVKPQAALNFPCAPAATFSRPGIRACGRMKCL